MLDHLGERLLQCLFDAGETMGHGRGTHIPPADASPQRGALDHAVGRRPNVGPMTPAPRQLRVLFVCMGNICRSPAGECVFRHYVREHGQAGTIDIDSAGTIGYHAGEPPDRRMIDAARQRGYTMTGAARQVRREDLDAFDLVVAMDRQNLRDLKALARTPEQLARIHLLTEFQPNAPGPDVPDPYYGGPEGFDTVLDMIEEACPTLLAHLGRLAPKALES